MQYFTRVHSLQSIIQIMDQAARRTPTHQLEALRACPRAWLQVLGLGRLLLGIPVTDVAADAGPQGPDARPRSAARPPSTRGTVFVVDDRRAPSARPQQISMKVYRPYCTHPFTVSPQLGTVFDRNIFSTRALRLRRPGSPCTRIYFV